MFDDEVGEQILGTVCMSFAIPSVYIIYEGIYNPPPLRPYVRQLPINSVVSFDFSPRFHSILEREIETVGGLQEQFVNVLRFWMTTSLVRIILMDKVGAGGPRDQFLLNPPLLQIKAHEV